MEVVVPPSKLEAVIAALRSAHPCARLHLLVCCFHLHVGLRVWLSEPVKL